MIKYIPLVDEIATIGTKEELAVWIAALRSGAYKQGMLTLHNADNGLYCCLGVSCLVVDNIDEDSTALLGARPPFNATFSVRAADTPIATIDGLASIYAAVLNDTHKLTFDQIADLLEGKEVMIENGAYQQLLDFRIDEKYTSNNEN